MTRVPDQPGYAQGFARLPGRRRKHPIHKELRAYWDARLGNTGATVYDQSGFGNDMVLAGAAHWTTGQHGHSLDFVRGTGDHAQAASLPHVNIVGHWSLAARLRITAVPGFNQGIVTCINAAGNGLWGLWVNNAQQPLAMMDENGVGQVTAIAGTAMTVGQTYDVAGLWDGANVRIFLEGEHENNAAAVGIPDGPQQDLCLACGAAAGANCLTCEIEYAAIWARDLTWAEIMDLHEDPFLLCRETLGG